MYYYIETKQITVHSVNKSIVIKHKFITLIFNFCRHSCFTPIRSLLPQNLPYSIISRFSWSSTFPFYTNPEFPYYLYLARVPHHHVHQLYVNIPINSIVWLNLVFPKKYFIRLFVVLKSRQPNNSVKGNEMFLILKSRLVRSMCG